MVWMSLENFAPTGVRTQDNADRRESLYRPSYTVPSSLYYFGDKKKKIRNQVHNIYVSYTALGLIFGLKTGRPERDMSQLVSVM